MREEREMPGDAMDREKLRALAAFLDRIDTPDFSPGTWKGGERQEDGAIQMPWFCASDIVDHFVQAAYDLGWVRNFDWPQWMGTKEAIRLRDDPEALGIATDDQLAKLLTVIIRQDRFVEGSIEEAFESGFIRAILVRAKALSDSGNDMEL